MKKLVWGGNPPEMDTPLAGRFVKGEPKEVSDEVAEQLLTHPDFKEYKERPMKVAEKEREVTDA